MGLLPLLYHALRRRGVDDPLLTEFEAVYLRTRLRNRLLLDRAGLLLDRLAEAGIPSMLLKGAALVHPYYDGDPGLRPMADVDIAVPTGRAVEAVDVVRRAGWVPRGPVTPSFLRSNHAAVFDDPHGDQCDLHWHVFSECRRPGADDALWQASHERDLVGRRIRVLSPSDQLLHVCVHGARWACEPRLRWIADAWLILARSTIDWPRVVDQARRRRFVIRMRDSLGFLRERMAADVPDVVLAALSAHPTDRLERFESRVLRRRRGLWGTLPVFWCHHRRMHDGGAISAALTLPVYLQHVWGCPTLGAVPAAAVVRVVRRLARALRPTPVKARSAGSS